MLPFFTCYISFRSLSLRLSSNWQEEFELWWKLIFGIKSIREIDSSNSAVSVNLNTKGLYVVGTVGSPGEIRQVELNLIPSLIESHGHCTDERLNSRRGLIVGCSESSSHTLIIQYLHLEREVLLQVLDDHNQERQFDRKGLLWVEGSVDVVGGHVRSHDFQNG